MASADPLPANLSASLMLSRALQRLTAARKTEADAIKCKDVIELKRALRQNVGALELLLAVSTLQAPGRIPAIDSAKKALPGLMKHSEAISEAIRNWEEEGNPPSTMETKSPVDPREAKPDSNPLQPSGEKELSAESRRLRAALSDCVVKEKPDLTWNDVAGLEGAKRAIEEAVVLPRRFPQLFQGKRKPWKGVLLYGPPGTGKTLIAKATASLAEATFFSVSSSSLVTKWFGDSEKLVRELFRLAFESRPAIIFIDEIDSIAGRRASDGEHDASRRLKTEFLIQMQKVLDGEGVMVLGATNRPFDLDPAVRRRFEKRIYIPLPDLEARRRLLRIHFGGTRHEDEFNLPNGLGSFCDLIAERCEGFSGSDIATLTREILLIPVRTAMRAQYFREVIERGPGGPGKIRWTPCSALDPGATPMKLSDLENAPETLALPKISEADFETALKSIRPSVSAADLAEQEEFTKQFGIPGQYSKPIRTESLREAKEIRQKWIENEELDRARSEKESAEERRLFEFVDGVSQRVEQRKRDQKAQKQLYSDST